jgi:hypothetical protein
MYDTIDELRPHIDAALETIPGYLVVMLRRNRNRDRIDSVDEFFYRERAGGVVGGNLVCSFIVGVEDAHEVGLGQGLVNAGVVLSHASHPDDPYHDIVIVIHHVDC